MSNQDGINDTQISKTLSWLLRHGAVKEKIPINSEGFVNVFRLLEHKSLKGKCTIDHVKRIVDNNNKRRFTLRTVNGSLEIKANQGHTLKVVDSLDLTLVNPSDNIDVIHGTYLKFWPSIKLNGLSRVKRNHIHFATGLPNDNVISGMRSDCDLYIYIDYPNAIFYGIAFYRSPNGVVLSAGNCNGFIETKYFLKVFDRNNKVLI